MKKLFYIGIILCHWSLMAQKLNVQVSTAKPTVGVPFEISFSINAIPQDFTPPSFNGFEIISGPNQSQNIQFINGSLSQSYAISYVLIPKKEGNIVIGSARAIVNNQTIQSNPITLEVQKGNPNNSYNAHQSNQSTEPSHISVNKEDVFVRTFVNKRKCYVGEQITLTQKIYTRIELRGIESVKFPHLEGFWSKNQENSNNIQLHIENIDGINYYVGEISTQYIFPQRSGKLTIPPIELQCVVRKRSNRPPRDIFEQFFGVNAYEDKSITLKSQPIQITVDELPLKNKPAQFSGAVGSNFSFKAEISKRKLPANDALTLKITISGTGNIPLIDIPKINFPQEFETYDPKITENISTANGIKGTKTFEYLIIPRKEGTYKLPELNFSYFDPLAQSYVTIPSPEMVVEVTPPLNNNNNAAQIYQQFKQEIKNEDNDIHYIKLYPYPLYKQDDKFFNSWTHLTLLIIPYLAMIGLFGFYQYQKSERANIVAFQQKRAQKIALKHLQLAEKMLKENKTAEFYTAIIQAIENYASFKFQIPKSELSREKIKQSMMQYQIPTDIQDKYHQIIESCELAKYAPVQSSHSLSDIYNDAKNLIIQIENYVKRV